MTAQHLHGLLEDPGWKKLYEIVQKEKSRWMDGLSKRLMTGRVVSQEEIAFHRGYFAGAEWAAKHPAEAIKSLEKAAEKAYALAQLQQKEEEVE